jgi:hypothetical protein
LPEIVVDVLMGEGGGVGGTVVTEVGSVYV